MHDDLRSILADCWRELADATADRRHGFHVPALCTIGVDGAPVARSVVLRRIDADACAIQCHTDARSAKVAEIERDARVTWLFYAPERKLQLRIAAEARFIAAGPRVDDAWAASTLPSRRCYLAPRAPGSLCDAPSANLPEDVLDRRPTEEETVPGRANFGIVLTHARSIDWLHLASEGHCRARFVRSEQGGWSGSWIEP